LRVAGVLIGLALLLTAGCARSAAPSGAPSSSARSSLTTAALDGWWTSTLSNDPRENGLPAKYSGTFIFTSDGRAALIGKLGDGQLIMARSFRWAFKPDGRSIGLRYDDPGGTAASDEATAQVVGDTLRFADGMVWKRTR
jgi:hypothetical protein